MKTPNVIFLAIAATIFLMVADVCGQSGCGDADFQCKVDANTKLIAADANNIEAYFDRALAYKQMGSYDLAITDLDKYISLKPSKTNYLADGYYNRGLSYKFLGDNTKMFADYNTAIGLFQGNAAYYVDRGAYYISTDDWVKAEADFEKAVQINPKDTEAYYDRAKVYSHNKQYTKAITDLDKYLSFDNPSKVFLADGYENRGLASAGLNQLTMAVDDLSKAIDLDPTKGRRFANRAIVYRKMGKIALAVADEKMAASLSQ